jgi:ring-1,2-phenylacetyl-CoA epoxidase subunit PaaE
MMTFTLKVVALHRESADAVTICFKQPGLKKVKYKPGQYLTVVVNINNRKYKRPYSLSSAPGIDDTLNITVKRLLHGIVSNHLLDVIKEGAMLEVIEPMGDFIYENDNSQDEEIFLWGAGSGITPLISILKTVLHQNTQKVTLLYCNKSLIQTIFYNQLTQLKKQYTDRFSLNLFCTEEENAGTIYGRVKDDHVYEVLKNAPDIVNTIHYICGPVGLKETVRGVLMKFGVKKEQIFSEDFEHVINEIELKEIQTRFVEIVKEGTKSKIEVIRGKSILEAGLDYEIDLPYSCQTGSCTLCKAKLISGEVKRIGTEAAEHGLNKDEQLLCCSYPLTDNVIFEIH